MIQKQIIGIKFAMVRDFGGSNFTILYALCARPLEVVRRVTKRAPHTSHPQHVSANASPVSFISSTRARRVHAVGAA
jgi:hypothetical protein